MGSASLEDQHRIHRSQPGAIGKRLASPGLLLTHFQPVLGSLEHGTQLRQGLQGGEGDHHFTPGGHALDHSLQQDPAFAATATNQHPVGGV